MVVMVMHWKREILRKEVVCVSGGPVGEAGGDQKGEDVL
jgi:hypothetical protein